MRNRTKRQHPWVAFLTRLNRSERGASVIEYTVIIALIAVTVMAGMPALAGAISDELGTGGLSVEYSAYVVGTCPEGNWELIDAGPLTKNGDDPNENGDGKVCQKVIQGGGQGNEGGGADLKDNDGDPSDP